MVALLAGRARSLVGASSRRPLTLSLVIGLAFALVVTPSMQTVGRAQTPVSNEYQVKAAFLFRFMQFVEWPKETPAAAGNSTCIGVLGNDPFGSALDDVVRNETINNRKLTVRRSAQASDLRVCSVVFVSRSESGHAADILLTLSGAPTLTVSEVEGFARLGGIINFFLEGNKVRFEINPTAARDRGLKIRSGLLKLGKIVESDPRKAGGGR